MQDLAFRRRSSRIYDPNRNIELKILEKLLETIRWAPSSTNTQPWQYIVFDHRTPVERSKMLSLLGEGNQLWAKNAPVLILSMAWVMKDGKPYNVGYHDLGLANENLMLAAVDLGLNIAPMGGFDKQKSIEVFNIPSDYRPIAVFSIGYPGNIEDNPEPVRIRENRPRIRKAIEEFTFLGGLGKPYQKTLEVESRDSNRSH